MPRIDFVVQTCEAKVNGERKVFFCSPDGDGMTPFDVGDPFGLRRAVVPVFQRKPDGSLIGLGTATHVDGWGGFFTAEHVLDFLRLPLPGRGLESDLHDVDVRSQGHATVMLGIGVVFGEVHVPDWAFADVHSSYTVAQDRDDPMASLIGRGGREIAVDLASFFAIVASEAWTSRVRPCTLPVQARGWRPKEGESILAFGYPGLEPSAIVSDVTMRSIIRDGLHAAYGTITRVFERGRDRAFPGPVFEVEANWPSGMSGGPVVNEAGNVIGVVSRSVAPVGNQTGRGYAVCLPNVQRLEDLLPSIDMDNPGWRVGYGVFDARGRLKKLLPQRDVATRLAAECGNEYVVRRCSQQICADDYMLLSETSSGEVMRTTAVRP